MLADIAVPRPAAGALVQIPSSGLNSIDLHRTTQPRPTKPIRSPIASTSISALDRPATAHTPRLRRPNPHSARGTPHIPPSRFPPLEAFGRRPPVPVASFVSGRHPKPFTI